MPIFEFECPHGHRIEVIFVRQQDVPDTLDCEEHGTDAPRVQFSVSSPQFKGDGWTKKSV